MWKLLKMVDYNGVYLECEAVTSKEALKFLKDDVF